MGPGRYETASFDDIGDMLEYAAKNTDKPPVAWYVHDYETKEWTDATTASYVASNRDVTPMAAGLMTYLMSALAAWRLLPGDRPVAVAALVAAGFTVWAEWGLGVEAIVYGTLLVLAGLPVYLAVRSAAAS